MNMELISSIMPFVSKYSYIFIIISGSLEGASIPFPGHMVLMTAGFIAYQGHINVVWVVALSAFFYSLASLIPYYIGKSLKGRLFDFLRERLKVPQKTTDYMERIFNKYGVISICITRPFFIGNYISYIGGMANIPIIKFFSLTFIGILPMIGLYLGLGYFFRGNFHLIDHFLERYRTVIFLIITLKLGLIMVWIIKKFYSLKNK